MFAFLGDNNKFTAMQKDRDCYGNYFAEYAIYNASWDSSDWNVASVSYNGMASGLDVGGATITATWDTEFSFDNGSDTCDVIQSSTTQNAGMIVQPPSVTNVVSQGATRISVSNTLGNTTITHFVTPKGAASSQVTLTVTISPNTQQIRNRISWEGAVESTTNPLQATISKDTAKKQVVKIKYGNVILKEFRVWVVWASIAPAELSIRYDDAIVIEPNVTGGIISGGYSFVHTIQPIEIFTDEDIPKFKGSNLNAPPGMNHPVTGESLAFGANKKWDNSRQTRGKRINPFNISQADTSQPPLPNLFNFPTDEVEGNDDANALPIEENNDPYDPNKLGKLTGLDRPFSGIAHRAGASNDTYEEHLQFREFSRLEIEGVWYKISTYCLWKLHTKFKKVNGKWINNGSVLELNNDVF